MVRVLFVAFQIFDNDGFDDVFNVLSMSFLCFIIVSKKNTPTKNGIPIETQHWISIFFSVMSPNWGILLVC